MTTSMVGYMLAESFVHNTDPTFRTWGKGLSDQMTAVGFAKTSDTGQIDWATVARPTTVSTFAGYEIRRMSDSLDTTYPIFVKIEYGTGPTSALRAACRVTVGVGSNGAGTITSPIFNAVVLDPGNVYAANVSVAMCRTEGLFWMALIPVTSSAGAIEFAIMRAQDATGTPTGEDWTVYATYGATTWATGPGINCIDRSAMLNRTNTTDYWSMPFSTRPSGMAAGRLVTPIVCAYPALTLCDAVVMTRAYEFTAFQTFQATVFQERTYLSLPFWTVQNTGNGFHAWVWE